MHIKEIINRLFNKLKKEPKLLTGETNEKTNNWKDSQKVNIIQNNIKKEYSIDDCILEYINQYIKQVDEGTITDISYRAFTRMFYDSGEDIGYNKENQKKLKEKILKSKKYRVDGQYLSNGDPIYYHISRKNEEMDKIDNNNPEVYRLYLNCERKNIAKLTGEILKKLDKIKDCSFKMKFIAESPESSIRKTYQRNDKIVIYVDNVIDKEKIINSITNLRQEKQELFSNSKQLPLMPKVNGFIGCVKQGKNIISTPLYDIRCTNTYNSKLSTIMEDCFICSLKQITSKNEDLAKITNCYSGNDIKPYLRAFRTMNSEQISQVVDIIKTQLIECCEKSHINIDKGNIDLNKTK